MAVFAKRRPTQVDRRQALASVPVLSANASVTLKPDETAVVRVKVPRGGTFFDRFRPPLMERKYDLDELGSFVVGQVDGKKDVLAIIEAFVERFRVNRREAELGVVSFLKTLTQRQVVTVLTPEQGSA